MTYRYTTTTATAPSWVDAVRAVARGEGARSDEPTPTPHDFKRGFVDMHLTQHEDRCRAIIKWTDKRSRVCGAKRDHSVHSGEGDQ